MFDRQAVYDHRSVLPRSTADLFFSLTTGLDSVQNSTKVSVSRYLQDHGETRYSSSGQTISPLALLQGSCNPL